VGLLLLLWVPTVPLPRRLVRSVGHVAAATLAIYLTHWQVFPPVREWLGAEASVVAALVVGTVGWWTGVRLAVLAAGLVRGRGGRRRAQPGRYAAATSPE
jgi:surface polysaccharide O-acyltransferase-like enzyme